jgi:DNA polymerase-3 subunit delta'
MASLELIIHPLTHSHIVQYIANPGHALLITGSKGIGKASVARWIVADIFDIHQSVPDTDFDHPYIRVLRPIENKAIPIESIREVIQFLSLKVPGSDPAKISRAVLIEDAHLLTTEAQNALLKTLEEPPEGTIVILTATSNESVLPTIRSRATELTVLPPAMDAVRTYFTEMGNEQTEVTRLLTLTGGLPGLTAAMLNKDEEHPLVTAITHAKGILQSKVYERLLLVDGLSKQKELCLDICYVLCQMARATLARVSDERSAVKWREILVAADAAERQLLRSAQSKLVLTNLMLAL